MTIQKKLIPINFTKGRGSFKPRAIVLHLMDGTLKGTDAWFRNKLSQASTHYGVGKDGTTYQWVEEKDTAWGNGRVYKPTWKLIDTKVSPNTYTISIEHEGVSGHEWTEEQYAVDAELIREIAARWNIPLDRDHIILHSEIYALKPSCTGTGLDMDKLMAMVNPSVIKNTLVKGHLSSSVYWTDAKGRLHAIPTWDHYLEYFGGEIKVIDQKVLDKMTKGSVFKP